MNTTKKLAIGLALTTIFSTVGTSVALATTTTQEGGNEQLQQETSMSTSYTNLHFSDSDVERMGKYVKMDTKGMKYTLTKDASRALSKKDLANLTKALKNSNEELEKLSNYDLKVDSAKKCFKITGYKTSDINEQTRYINKSEYWDYELRWWGKRLYFHNNFVKDLKAYVISYTAGGAVGAAVAAFIAEACGTTGPVGGVFAALTAFEFAYFYDKLVNNNIGNGVYADAYYTDGMLPTSFKYYGA